MGRVGVGVGVGLVSVCARERERVLYSCLESNNKCALMKKNINFFNAFVGHPLICFRFQGPEVPLHFFFCHAMPPLSLSKYSCDNCSNFKAVVFVMHKKKFKRVIVLVCLDLDLTWNKLVKCELTLKSELLNIYNIEY